MKNKFCTAPFLINGGYNFEGKLPADLTAFHSCLLARNEDTTIAPLATMSLLSALFLLLPSINLISCLLHQPHNPASREDGRRNPSRDQHRQPRSVSLVKVLDFSADNDQQPDNNGEYTEAIQDFGPLPETFTICVASMSEAWTTPFPAHRMWNVIHPDGNQWAYNYFDATEHYYEAEVGPVSMINTTEGLIFPTTWVRNCLAVGTTKLRMVADGELLMEKEYKSEEDKSRPANLLIRLGLDIDAWDFAREFTGRVADLNVFKSDLSVDRMKGITTAGGKECGAPGDLVNWEEAEWTLHSQAKWIEVDREWEGPCRRESQVQVFTADFTYHKDCMHHCQKISGGRSPPVTTREEWETLTREADLITQDRSSLPWMWLSATEGDNESKLAKLGHWPETELVNNETKKLEAVETIWRDFYTGQRLGNWTKPYHSTTKKDTWYGETYNCMPAYTDEPWTKSWYEWECSSYDKSCPCS